ncbi:MAG: alkaline phosphatase family protein, partial [Thermoanaerobaculia bacterium]|nr:alkaline phosphatase family protein [Thermoanaerobaculia bacterium]
MLGLLVLAATDCRRDDTAAGSVAAPGAPVVLISIDTLRADRLPAYGYEEVETPAIDALRNDSILYERAWSHIPLTLPSHASIFTGLLPTEHGVRDNLGVRFDKVDEVPYLPRR